MPREVMHWHVLDEAELGLPKESQVKRCLDQYPAVAAIGALAHDALYYLEGGRSPLDEVANLMHGSRMGDPLAPLVSALEYVRTQQDSAAQQACLAFIVGMLSHSCTDIVFHPMIFYFTGEYHHPDTDRRRLAQQRHRIIEVYLDMWVVAQQRLSWNAQRISSRLQQAEPMRGAIAACLAQGLLPGLRREFPQATAELWTATQEEMVAHNWYRGLEDMAFYQKLFFSWTAGQAARALSWAWPQRFGPLEALALAGRSKHFHQVLAQEFNYVNPVTEEPKQARLDDLRREAIELTKNAFLAVDAALNSANLGENVTLEENATLPENIATQPAAYQPLNELLSRRSLNYGAIDAPVGTARFYATEGLALPDLHFREG